MWCFVNLAGSNDRGLRADVASNPSGSMLSNGLGRPEEEVTLSLDAAILSSKMTWGLKILLAAVERPEGKWSQSPGLLGPGGRNGQFYGSVH